MIVLKHSGRKSGKVFTMGRIQFRTPATTTHRSTKSIKTLKKHHNNPNSPPQCRTTEEWSSSLQQTSPTSTPTQSQPHDKNSISTSPFR
ncbi:uncharacterized protein N7506_009856 [Penicillium brevicompactum]|uniref:uncharacterized protein n=1 Tax=Penicillium brevicompactum TaxID=5074 RepID=UPI0025421BA4|nr:uncharacterized protein N7506_009856 [Penicillium brevicompactum]KAJ5326754.1 hypothetical protein N7506_009856 [Penicillium brevicompactum]